MVQKQGRKGQEHPVSPLKLPHTDAIYFTSSYFITNKDILENPRVNCQKCVNSKLV